MASQPSTAATDLAFRRQFYLGPEFPDLLSGWEQYRVTDRLLLSVHPDLPYTRADMNGRTLILLGYALDPGHPDRSDQGIVDAALLEATTFDLLLEALHPIAGRWAAIYVSKDHAVAFHDPTGSRQIYHSQDDGGTLRTGSSAGLLSRVTGNPRDVASLSQLTRENVFRENFTHFWPGSGSAFHGINRLLPNHYLNLHSGNVERFWPTSPIPPLDRHAAVSLSMETLTGVVNAAHVRFPLALSLTAGFDSRLVLAAARAVAHDITYYTYQRPGMTTLTPDLRVPRKMLRDLDLSHKIIRVEAHPASDPVVEAISASVAPFHPNVANQAASLIADPPRKGGVWVTLNGNAAEIAQCRLRRLPVTPENLARNARMPDSDYAMKHLAEWHERSSHAFTAAGANPWDMLYWEHKMGGWYATVRTEFDAAEEVVTPYNSRAWLEGMLGTDPALRSAPDWPFFRSLIGELWPKLLDYPFNPRDPLKAINDRARSTMRRVVKPAAARFRTSTPQA